MTAPVSKKTRPRRIAADEAHAWARNLRLSNPYAKLVLSMLTLYVNGEGSCFVGASTLAEDCELALETVRRRLGWLEAIGAIARFPQWLDDNGRRNSESRGRRTTDDIRLLLNADIDDIEARASGEKEASDQHDVDKINPLHGMGQSEQSDRPAEPFSPPHGRGLTEDSKPLTPPLGVYQPPHCGGGLDSSEPEPEPEDSPKPPRGGMNDAHADEQSEAADGHNVEGWQEFKTAFEADGIPIIRVSIAKTLFSALTTEHRHRVTHAAKGLIAYRAREKKPGTKPSAQTFIREIDAWAAFEKLAPAAPVIRIKIQRGSDAFSAATVFKMLVDRTAFTVDEIEIREGLATSPDFLALAQFADPGGSADRSAWLSLDPHDHGDKSKIGAWRERIKAWSGRWVEFEKVPELDAQGQPIVSIQMHNGMELKFPKMREALLVPLEWPPSKDGGTGPPKQPDTLMTEDDAAQFSKAG